MHNSCIVPYWLDFATTLGICCLAWLLVVCMTFAIGVGAYEFGAEKGWWTRG